MKWIFPFLMMISIFMLDTAIEAKAGDTQIKVMYFHGPTRCEGCILLESYISESVSLLYPKELKSGDYTFSSLDFLEEQNADFEKLYKIESQTLIISKIEDGKEVKWVELDKIWDYSNNFKKFKKYISVEMKKFLKS